MDRMQDYFRKGLKGTVGRRLSKISVEFLDGQDNIKDILGKKFHKKMKNLLEIS